MDLWQQIVDALEDAEDIGLARAALDELTAAGGDPKKAGWVDLEDVINLDALVEETDADR
jgi:predicted DNA-binding protein